MDKLLSSPLSESDHCPVADEQDALLTKITNISTFSWTTRIQGFLVCFALGFIFSFVGSFCVLLHNGLVLFAVFYTLGNVTALSSTCFLMGPVNQLKKMFAPTRLLATTLTLVFIGLTLCSAFWWSNPALVILFCIVQFASMSWYSISYIPFARDAVLKFCGFCLT